MPGSRKVRWTVGTAVLCLLLAVAGWFLLISPRLAQADDLAARNISTEHDNTMLQMRIEQLKAQSAELPSYRAELAGMLRQLPPGADMPQLVRDLNSLAVASGVTVDSLTPGIGAPLSAASAGAGAPATAGAAGAGTSGAAGAGSAGTGATGTGAGGTAGAAGVVQVPLSAVVHGDYFQAVAFLQKLQTRLTRAMLITGVQVAQFNATQSPGTVQLTITASVFAWPAGDQLASAAVPTTSPTGTPSPAASSTSTAPATATAGTSASPSPTTGGQP